MAAAPNPRLRGRIELVLRVAGPFLDLGLAVGDRVSRVLARGDAVGSPVRMAHPGQAAPRALRQER